MTKDKISRRGFVAAGAGAAVLAGAGYVGLSSLTNSRQANADALPSDASAAASTALPVLRHSLCNACSNKCGFTAYLVDGRLTKLVGDAASPYGKGKLCARGYGYATIAYDKDRLTEPLKRNGDGSFSAISWEQAYSEIATIVSTIIASDGAEALALVHDPRPSGAFYGPRFLAALGSPNVYTHGAACNLSKNSGFAQVFGAGDYTADIANARMVMFIGRNPAEAIRPSALKAMQVARQHGARFVHVDPRLPKSFAPGDEWLSINPGTDLALVLAMAHVIVQRGTYNKTFVAERTVGFEDWAARLAEYSPDWAAQITGLPAATISRLAGQFAEAAPAAVIDAGWRGAYGCAYLNSGETARAIALFNTLLGNWNQPGGALLYPSVAFGKLDANKFPAVPEVTAKKLGSAEYPLALNSMGSSVYAAQAVNEGKLKGMFFYTSNMAAGYTNPAYLAEALGKLDLNVVIDVQMSETAQLAHYVLPDTSYLERLEVPEAIAGAMASVALRDAVLSKLHEKTRPVDQIFSELAVACGVGEYFSFNVEQLAEAQLQTIGLNLQALQQVGSAQFEGKPFNYGVLPELKTPTGKLQFTSEACVQAGYPASPGWLEPKLMPAEGQFRLIGGKQAVHSHTMTTNNPDLMHVSKKYNLIYPWINASIAAKMGIKDGDEVELASEVYSGRTRIHVTEAINPTAVYLPSHYGCSAKDLKTGYGVGLRQMDFVPFQLEPGYGSAMTQEVLVTVKKVGA